MGSGFGGLGVAGCRWARVVLAKKTGQKCRSKEMCNTSSLVAALLVFGVECCVCWKFLKIEIARAN